jgi:antimicrobial peptide system SdpA family protein
MRAGSVVEHPGEVHGPAPEPPGTGELRTGRRVAVLAVLAATLAAYALHAALPATPFELPGPQPETVRMVLPEGWAFFTKSPRSQYPEVYQRQPGGGWRGITAGPLAVPDDLLGLDRFGRSQGTEVALLLAQLPRDAWQECEREPTSCLRASRVVHELVNRSTHHSACGEIGFVVREVLPWAWRDAPTVMPSAVARARVAC